MKKSKSNRKNLHPVKRINRVKHEPQTPRRKALKERQRMSIQSQGQTLVVTPNANRSSRQTRNNPNPAIQSQIKQETLEETILPVNQNTHSSQASVTSSTATVACQTQQEEKAAEFAKIIEQLTFANERLLKENTAKSEKIERLEYDKIELIRDKQLSVNKVVGLKEEIKDLKQKLISFTFGILKQSENRKRTLIALPTESVSGPAVKKSKLTEISQNTDEQTIFSSDTNFQTSFNSFEIEELDQNTSSSPSTNDENNEFATNDCEDIILIDNTNTPDLHVPLEKIDRKLMFSGDQPLNVDLWRTLKNNSKNEMHLNVKELNNREHQDECRRVIDYIINLARTEFDRKISFTCMSKTGIGYTVHLQCSKGSKGSSGCKSRWYYRINVLTNELNATCNLPCIHTISMAPKKKEKIDIEMQIKRPMDENIWSALKNNKNRILPPLSQLTKRESDELDSISNEFKEHLSNIGLKSGFGYILKTEAGYTFRRVCGTKGCHALIYFRVNVTDRIGIISYNKECQKHN